MLKLIMFDMDGLMLDTEQLYYQAFSEVCARYNLDSCRNVYLETVGSDDELEREIYKKNFPKLDVNSFCAEIQALCEKKIFDGDVSIKPGLFQLLDAIDSRSHILKAVVTSNCQAIATALLEQAGIFARLDGGVYREMVSRGKPAPDPYLLCCELFSVSPKEALVLEDSEPGLLAAQAAGVHVIAIPDLVMPSEKILLGCLAKCSSLESVIPYLDKI